MSERLLPFLFALGFFWLATMTPGRLARRAIPAVVALVCVTTAGYRIWQYHRLNGFLDEYVSAAGYIEPNSTLLPIHFWRETDARSGPPPNLADPSRSTTPPATSASSGT